MHLTLIDHFLSYFSPKSLAHYLKLLDADDAKFNEYFWWRDFYARRFRHHQAMCDVCEKLHSPDKETKIYQARPFNITGLHTQYRRNVFKWGYKLLQFKLFLGQKLQIL